MAKSNLAAAPQPYKKPSERMKGPFDDYEVKDALRTLTEAEKIKRNKGLMRAILLESDKQIEAAKAAKKTIQGGK